ncbi:hypothetical protein JM93_00711 [Roseibium hamelinense]|uniref:Uncharacterized protein n=1 Tax=Roseibium hamelinense TaxID=150831 RepID=A0A562TJF1_9HYPH|nr:hypothetical protein JM93_00711 [Roseibium hamelinense]
MLPSGSPVKILAIRLAARSLTVTGCSSVSVMGLPHFNGFEPGRADPAAALSYNDRYDVRGIASMHAASVGWVKSPGQALKDEV